MYAASFNKNWYPFRVESKIKKAPNDQMEYVDMQGNSPIFREVKRLLTATSLKSSLQHIKYNRLNLWIPVQRPSIHP